MSDLVPAKEAAKSDQMKEVICKFSQSAMEIAHTKVPPFGVRVSKQ